MHLFGEAVVISEKLCHAGNRDGRRGICNVSFPERESQCAFDHDNAIRRTDAENCDKSNKSHNGPAFDDLYRTSADGTNGVMVAKGGPDSNDNRKQCPSLRAYKVL
jgi:hypothetical protein